MELKITKKQALLIELMCRSAQSDMDINSANDNIFYEYKDEIKPLMFLVTSEGKEPANEASGLSKHAVTKSVCPKCGNDKYFESKNEKTQCRTCGRWFRQTVL